jgi:hypothetical protein
LAPALARRAGIVVAAWAAAVGVLALNRFLVGVFYDDGLYAGLAAALASGDGFVHPHLPGSPAAIHYPPLYPVILAPLFGLLGPDAAGVAGKLMNLVLAAAAAGLIAAHAAGARLLGDRVSPWVPAVVVGAAAAAIPVLTTQSVLFAEPLFAALLAAAVLLGDRAAERRDGRLAFLAGLAAALTLLTRTVGVAAGAGVVAFIALRDRRAAIRAAIPVAVASVGWLTWTLTHRAGIDAALAINYGSYGEVLRQAGLGALGSSAADLPRPLFAITLAWLPRGLAVPFGIAAGAAALYGLWLLSRRSSVGFTLGCYLAILAIWPFPPDRFLWAVLPWLALAFAAGIAPLLRRPWLRVPAAATAAAALLGYAIYEGRGLPRRAWASQAAAISANFNEVLPALRALPESAVLAVDNESLVWLYTGRRAVPLFLYGYAGATVTYPTAAEQRAYLTRQGVTHVVLASSSSPSAAQLRALIGAYPGWLEPVHGWPGGRWIFAVRP